MRVEKFHSTARIEWSEADNRIISEVFNRFAGQTTLCEIDRAIAEQLGREPQTVMKQRLRLGLRVVK